MSAERCDVCHQRSQDCTCDNWISADDLLAQNGLTDDIDDVEPDTRDAEIAQLRTDLARVAQERDGAREQRDNADMHFVEWQAATTSRLGIDPMSCRLDVEEAMDALCSERQRLHDLVRHQRGALYDAELITNEEYAALAEDHGAVARLEGYDALRARGEALAEAVQKWDDEMDTVRRHDRLTDLRNALLVWRGGE